MRLVLKSLAGACAGAVLAGTVLLAQRGEAPPPKPYVPVPASVLAKNPDALIGQNVTITAFVDKILSKSAFAVDQKIKGAPANADILVLAPILNEPVERSKYVTVAGELVRFDPGDVEKKVKGYRVDLPADLVAKYRGRPAVIAKVVVNDKMVDVAMRLPPPMSADEKVLDDTMKKVAPAVAALRTAVDGSKTDAAAPQIAVLKQAFAQTEAFWKSKNVPEAVKIAQEARSRVDAVERNSAENDWDSAKKSVAALNQTCGSCHQSYREQFDEGSYRVKLP